MSESRNSVEYSGGCACGSVRFVLAGEPRWVVVCHCNECKKRTGSVFGVSAVFAEDGIESQTGMTRVFTRTGDSGQEVHYEFCPECGTTIRWRVATIEGVAADSYVYACGGLDEPDALTPPGEMYADDRVSWLDLGLGLSCSGSPDDGFRGQLIDGWQAGVS